MILSRLSKLTCQILILMGKSLFFIYQMLLNFKITRKCLTLNSQEGQPLVTLCPTMTETLRSSLISKFNSALPGHLKPTDTTEETASQTNCETVHFDWYNRYSTDVRVFYFNLRFYCYLHFTI